MALPTPAEAEHLIATRTAVSQRVVAVALDVSEAHISRLIAADEFPFSVVRMGARTVIPTPALRDFLSIPRADAPDSAVDPAA